ncbi:MAG: 5,6-dimethylbenzimidazole synthase, partial [Sulfobacillus sp.]|nr:5,6-dimethylbenzimidazole synthase [Sulfobacillus sp.]
RILRAGHSAPSVGFMQPWNFVVIQNRETLQRIYQVVDRERVRAADNYRGLQKEHYLRLKVEGLLQAPVTLCVTLDPRRGGPHVLGRNTIPETDLMSVACAIENIWLAARAEGVAVGWVSMYQKDDIREILGIPESIDPVALLSLGYTPHFPDEPGLQRAGWARRLPLADIVFRERWGESGEFGG